jgi:uncharacterized protein YdhG (YjbR/CyaY superfamily)
MCKSSTVPGEPLSKMTKSDFKSVDASQPEAVQGALQRVRSTIRKAVPGAEEVISYQIPAYKLPGGPVLYFAGWKQHYSLYPANAHLVAALKDDLAPYETQQGYDPLPAIRARPCEVD